MKTKLFILLAACLLSLMPVSAQSNAPVTTAMICRDLVGHSLSEGTPEGYYSRDWKWNIEEGEISNFRILSVRENTATHYTIDVQMRLTAVSGHCSYNAKATVYYVRGTRGWELEMIKSRGVTIVKTHRYDDCIHQYRESYSIHGGRIHLENQCEIALEVGGRYNDGYGWKKFSVTVSSHGEEIVGSFIEDYIIDYIERP